MLVMAGEKVSYSGSNVVTMDAIVEGKGLGRNRSVKTSEVNVRNHTTSWSKVDVARALVASTSLFKV